jgi:hypothetical protein
MIHLLSLPSIHCAEKYKQYFFHRNIIGTSRLIADEKPKNNAGNSFSV